MAMTGASEVGPALAPAAGLAAWALAAWAANEKAAQYTAIDLTNSVIAYPFFVVAHSPGAIVATFQARYHSWRRVGAPIRYGIYTPGADSRRLIYGSRRYPVRREYRPDSSGLARLGRDLKRHAAVNASMRRRVRTILQTAMRK
jgi:hypothetical protein